MTHSEPSSASATTASSSSRRPLTKNTRPRPKKAHSTVLERTLPISQKIGPKPPSPSALTCQLAA
jgi:hypothetical protein